MNTLKRLSLGQSATIGTLYSAHKDTFLDESLLLLPPTTTNDAGEQFQFQFPPDAILSTDLRNAETTAQVTTGTIKEKFEHMGVTPELGASLLAGLISPHGSTRYLFQQADSVPTAQRAVVYTINSRIEQLNFMSAGLREHLNLGVLSNATAAGATHVLTGITWGARAVVSARRRTGSGTMGTAHSERKLDDMMKVFLRSDEKQTGTNAVGNVGAGADDATHLRIYTDVREVLDGPADDLADAVEHFSQLRTYVELTGGKPVVYTLLPLAFLVTLGAMVSGDDTAGQLSPECYEKLVGLFDHITYVQQALNEHLQKLAAHQGIVSQEHLAEVQGQLRRTQEAEADLRLRFAEALNAVREKQATSQAVSELIDNVLASVPSPQELATLTVNYDKKLDFLSRMVGLGASYVGDKTMSPQEILTRSSTVYRVIYAFYFNNEAMDPTNRGWTENMQIIDEVLAKTQPRPHVMLIDCDTYQMKLAQPYISVIENGVPVVENLLEQIKELAGKSLVKYDRSYLENTHDVPTYRKSVRIPCPGPFCDSQTLCFWVCADCQETLEFGSRDGYFYCDCGRFPFDRASFNCQKSSHRAGFYQFDRDILQDLLKSLPAPREVNILILGETGVGKSTFVNAFVNYLTFGSLDDGLKNSRLNCIIPCSFTTQVVDDEGVMISKDVVIGSDSDEADGSKGQSATQKATVYPLYFRDTLIRLIDTPGIGDTRGLEQDKQNMANMLSILRNYPALHGILILLKPNNARLGVMFRFCVKELLTHLHTSAAENMVFGFTNTRGSNYTPGDTFKPLESLLADYNNVIPQLSRSNVYCFDSESFRYLAARKKGIEMGHIDDYRRSWEHSSREADRLLAHFQSLHPHHTQETLSLNETRHLIAQLTAPMQQISVAITDTISKSQQQVLDLQNAKLTGNDLRSRLHIQKTTVKAEQLKKPKTVCSNEACVESVFDEGSNVDVLLRKKLCHNPCCLTNVPVGKVGTPQLEHCAAFEGVHCTVCGHHWKEHEHILVEYSKTKETVTDPTVQHELRTNGDLIKAKESAIKALQKNIDELRKEHKQVQTAAARFSLYLKHNSITHYNDATIEYLEHLIKDERTKVRTGQNRARLDSLEKDLDDYRKFVDAMEQGKSDSDGKVYMPLNEAGVAKLVETLYNLPHYGQMLKDLAQVVANAYEANFRERPYRISRKRHWREQRDAAAQNWPLFGRRMSVRNPGWGSQSASSGFSRSDNRFSGSMNSNRHNNNTFVSEKSLSNMQQDNPADFWPSASSEKQGLSDAPVRSIMNWDPSVNYGAASSSGFHTSMFDSSVAAPPPYPGSHTNNINDSSAWQNGEPDVDERKGVWLRLKDRLRKW